MLIFGSIDCAGILKLRNSDIELRKGETDIGRKNTRVRLVFRVHIPQPNGRTLSLQVASNPIECCEYHPLPPVSQATLGVSFSSHTFAFPVCSLVNCACPTKHILRRNTRLHPSSVHWCRVCF